MPAITDILLWIGWLLLVWLASALGAGMVTGATEHRLHTRRYGQRAPKSVTETVKTASALLASAAGFAVAVVLRLSGWGAWWPLLAVVIVSAAIGLLVALYYYRWTSEPMSGR